jgi:cytochrome c-type biogenesis protein
VDAQNINLVTALIAGLLSFFSPCVFPLIPVYLGYMTGTLVTDMDESSRLRVLSHAVFFVLGFSLVFVLLGAAAGLLGGVIQPAMPYLTKIGGLILIIFGLHMMGIISIPFLNMEKRLELGNEQKKNYWSSFLVGLVFALGWTPCIGPVLSAILILAADSQTAGIGALLLGVYALGLGVPFLIVALLLDVLRPALKALNRHLRVVSIAGGVLLLVMGFLLLTGLFQSLVFWFNSFLAF